MSTGRCRLTGEVGPLVKAHILPKALTYPAEKGLPFTQSGRDSAPIKRWSSWYDSSIVTAAGEKILADYDNWAIDALRQHRLIWSSWDGGKLVSDDCAPVPDFEDWGVRKISGLDGGRLRLFFLSLLWRAAVSGMDEFREVDIHASDIRRLGRMLREGDAAPYHRFPISLVQLSTKGAVHNHTPIAQRKPRDISNPNGSTIPIFRFYMDGLIAHIHRESNEEEVERLGSLLVGGGEQVVVTTVSFEKSWQRENLGELMEEAFTRWPDRMERMPGFGTQEPTSEAQPSAILSGDPRGQKQ